MSLSRLLPLLALLALALPGAAHAGKGLDDQLAKAQTVLTELGGEVPASIRKRARCVSVLTLGKGGFIVGGTGGGGFVTCRDEGGGEWSAPVVLDVGGGSAGAQIGGAKVQVVMVFVDVGDIEEVVHATPVFHGQASATAGTKGAGVSGGGNPEIEGGVFTVSRSEGLYAGAVGEALVVDPDRGKTRELLGTDASVGDVLLKRKVAVPPKAKPFVDAVAGWVGGS